MKKMPLLLALFCLLSTSLFTAAAAPPYTVIEDKATLPILSPSLSERKVLKIRLANGLEAYLVSDPNTDKSAAMLTVMVGSWEDPKDSAGIAHFTEHMLFMGNKKYPNESEYDRYLKENDGETNAFTTNDQTSFMFTINNDAFEGGLDRFSQFFKEPLFNPSGVDRELQAINQEYSKNIENDDIRVLFIRKSLSNPEHPFHSFNMGNKASLSTVAQETLKAWYHEHYSANLMRLVVHSNLPIEKLRDLVVADFSGIPNADKKLFSTQIPLVTPQMEGHILYVEPVKDARALTLIWSLPADISLMTDTKPDVIIGYLLGYEGKGSLLELLKQEKLATALECGKMKLNNTHSDFYMEITLTDKGIHEIDTVIQRCFQALALFRQKGIPQYIYDDIRRMGVIAYQYQPRIAAFMSMMQQAQWITEEPVATYPEHTLIVQKFDPQALQQMLNIMTPQRVQIVVLAPPDVTGVKPDKKEPWVGGSYAVKDILPKRMADWSRLSLNPQITLPPPNPFIPQSLQVVGKGPRKGDNDKLNPHPKAIVNDSKGKIYFAQDTRYRVPNIYWYFEIKTPSIEAGNAEKVVLADLYVSALKEALHDFVYPASQAGLNFDIEIKANGIAITLEGYSEKAPMLFNEITKRLKNPEVLEPRFKVHKETLLREYQNFSKEMPISQASEILHRVLHKYFTTEKEKAAAIKKVTFAKLQEYITGLFSQNYVEGLLYGNMLEKDAVELSKNLFVALGGSPYPKDQQQKKMVLVLPQDEGPFILESKTKSQGSVLILAIEDINFSFTERAAQQILMQALDEPFFATLRTKQQTGYIVSSSGDELEKHLFDIFLVQSNTHEPRDLLARFELFIESYLQEMALTELPEERFKLISASQRKTLEQPRKNTQEMGELLRTLAFKYDGDFDWMEKRIQAFDDLKYEEFLTIARNVLGKTNKRRIAIMLKGAMPTEDILDYKRVMNLNQLIKQSSYADGE